MVEACLSDQWGYYAPCQQFVQKLGVCAAFTGEVGDHAIRIGANHEYQSRRS